MMHKPDYAVLMQSTHMASGEIDEKAVYQCTGNPLPQDVEQIATWLFNEDFATCFNSAPPPRFPKVSHSHMHPC